MNTSWPWPGARWWKVDFHSHTPASKDYKEPDITPEAWLQAAMAAELDCVAVTDHNSAEWIDELQKAYRILEQTLPPWFRPLTLFPGVEITVADSKTRVHLLALFAPQTPGNTLTSLLGACGIHNSFGDSEGVSTGIGFQDTLKKIEHARGLAIPAHIDGKHGLLDGVTSPNPELIKSLEGLSAAEFCNSDFSSTPQEPFYKILQPLARLGGSDAHNLANIGRYFSWIKMGDPPTLEGVRQALKDHEFSVLNQSQNPNQPPDFFLTGLSIQNTRYCGRSANHPFAMKFHPHFNVLIGGRGTGKSTVLESIRVTGRREAGLESIPRIKAEVEGFQKLVTDKGVMLPESELLLHFSRMGQEFRLRWRQNGSGPVYEGMQENIWKALEPGDVAQRCPVDVYSQKQIFELATSPKGILAIIDGSPEVNRQEWQQNWNSTVYEIKQLRIQQRQIQSRLAQKPEYETKINECREAIKYYESLGYGEILRPYQKCSQQTGGLPLSLSFDDLIAEINQAAEKCGISDFPHHLFMDEEENKEELVAIHANIQFQLDSLNKELLQIASSLQKIAEERNNKILQSRWYQYACTVKHQHDQLVAMQSNANVKTNLSDYSRRLQDQKKYENLISELETLQKDEEKIKSEFSTRIKYLLQLRDELFNKRKNFINSVLGDNAYVRMELVQFAEISSIEYECRELLGFNETDFATAILDVENKRGELWELYNCNTDINKGEIVKLINQTKKRFEDISKRTAISGNKRFDDRLHKIRLHQPDNLDNFLCWWPEDRLNISYSVGRDNKFTSLNNVKGSPGQKAAAILAFLLSHGTNPLIMDQPEDDLDNALIHDLVVKQIHKNKVRRQLIIVTHNPNIVVNGDAELVHVLNFENGQILIKESGSLENPTIREKICDIMEGGKEAFRKRYHRILSEH